MKWMSAVALALALILVGAPGSSIAGAAELVSYPLALDPSCRGGRAKLYDECSDQRALYLEAFERAEAEGKTLLVSFGAEWCAWCHLFAEAVKPSTPASAPRARLAAYVADHFVLVHIEAEHAPGGDAVVLHAGGSKAYRGLPFIYSVRPDGWFAMALDHGRVQRPRSLLTLSRSYDLEKLAEALTEMRAAAAPRDQTR